MASDKNPEVGLKSLLDFTLSANVKLRAETSKLQISLDDRTAGIQALIQHVSRVENHARHVENVTKQRYESSISWKVTGPLRAVSRILSKILKALTHLSRS